jgi:hypothetical protein
MKLSGGNKTGNLIFWLPLVYAYSLISDDELETFIP